MTSGRSDGWFCITAGAVAIVAGIVVSLWPTMVLAALLATVAIGLALSLRRRLSPVLLSPVWLAVGGLVLLATVGGARYGHFAADRIRVYMVEPSRDRSGGGDGSGWLSGSTGDG